MPCDLSSEARACQVGSICWQCEHLQHSSSSTHAHKSLLVLGLKGVGTLLPLKHGVCCSLLLDNTLLTLAALKARLSHHNATASRTAQSNWRPTAACCLLVVQLFLHNACVLLEHVSVRVPLGARNCVAALPLSMLHAMLALQLLLLCIKVRSHTPGFKQAAAPLLWLLLSMLWSASHCY
jgi:hypothetical protein